MLLPLTWIVVVAVREAVSVAQSVAAAVQQGGVGGLTALAPQALRPWLARQISEQPQWSQELLAKLPLQGWRWSTLGAVVSATGAAAFSW